MSENLDDINYSTNYWLEEKINNKNIISFIKFIGKMYPEHSAHFNDIRKKMLRKNRSILSILITFLREVDKNDKKNEDLIKLVKKLMQTIMDNPKGFKFEKKSSFSKPLEIIS